MTTISQNAAAEQHTCQPEIERRKQLEKSVAEPQPPGKDDTARVIPQFFLLPLKLEELPAGEDPISSTWLGAKYKEWHGGSIPDFIDRLLADGWLAAFKDHRDGLIQNFRWLQGAVADATYFNPKCHRVVGAFACYVMGIPRARWPKKFAKAEKSEFMPIVVPTDPAQQEVETDMAITGKNADAPDDIQAPPKKPMPAESEIAIPNPPMLTDLFATMKTALDEEPEATLNWMFDLIRVRFSMTIDLEAKESELEHGEQSINPEEIVRLTRIMEDLEDELQKERTAKEGALSSARIATEMSERLQGEKKRAESQLRAEQASVIKLQKTLIAFNLNPDDSAEGQAAQLAATAEAFLSALDISTVEIVPRLVKATANARHPLDDEGVFNFLAMLVEKVGNTVRVVVPDFKADKKEKW